MDISYKIANTILEFENGKDLFQQYANSLNLDLSFQDFTKELETIDKQRPPNRAKVSGIIY